MNVGIVKTVIKLSMYVRNLHFSHEHHLILTTESRIYAPLLGKHCLYGGAFKDQKWFVLYFICPGQVTWLNPG